MVDNLCHILYISGRIYQSIKSDTYSRTEFVTLWVIDRDFCQYYLIFHHVGQKKAAGSKTSKLANQNPAFVKPSYINQSGFECLFLFQPFGLFGNKARKFDPLFYNLVAFVHSNHINGGFCRLLGKPEQMKFITIANFSSPFVHLILSRYLRMAPYRTPSELTVYLEEKSSLIVPWD